MDVLKLYQDYSVKTPDKGHKHYRDGWVQTECPFCSGDPGYHLGFNLQYNYYNCWRCGHVPLEKGIAGVLGISYKKAKEIIKEYKGISHVPKAKIKAKKRAFKLPNNIYPLTDPSTAKQYMNTRGFSNNDIQTLINDFGLMRTGATCIFMMNGKPVDLKFRILAPIYYNGEMISWQTRDIRNKSNLKYITCPKESEKMDHKKVIYLPKKGDLLLRKRHSIILCEGIFDVWKVHLAGFHCGCGFGVDLTMDQIHYLRQFYNHVIFFMDPDKAGQRKSKEIFSQLAFSGVHCSIVKHNLDKDPGDMKVQQIREIVQDHIYYN